MCNSCSVNSNYKYYMYNGIWEVVCLIFFKAVSLQYNILKSKLLTCNIRTGCILNVVMKCTHEKKSSRWWTTLSILLIYKELCNNDPSGRQRSYRGLSGVQKETEDGKLKVFVLTCKCGHHAKELQMCSLIYPPNIPPGEILLSLFFLPKRKLRLLG